MNIFKSLIWASCYILLLFTINTCQNEPSDPALPPEDLYFPPNGETIWEMVAPQELDWATENIPDLERLLEDNGTRAFILLKDGKIVLEFYYA